MTKATFRPSPLLLAAVFALSWAGCSSSPDPLPPPGPGGTGQGAGASGTGTAATQPPPAPKHPLVAACDGGDAAGCAKAGLAYYEGKEGLPQDRKIARELFVKSCQGQHPAGCFQAGMIHFKGEGGEVDKVTAAQHFGSACQLNLGMACGNAGIMHYTGDGVPKAFDKAKPLFEKGCQLDDAKSCFNLAAMYANGEGVPQDAAKAAPLMAKACKLGDKEACPLAEQLATPATPTVQGANVTMGSTSVNGMELRNLSCRVTGLGLFGAMALAAQISKAKRALDKCAPKGAAPLAHWTFKNSRATDVQVTRASDLVNACVARALKNTPYSGNGECVATMLIGNKQNAEAEFKKQQ